jgi:hypothetical protein
VALVKLGILEFGDNEFVRSVVERLADVPMERIRIGELPHPSPSPYRVIVDRVSFCDPYLRQVMRYWSLGGAYVINNPFFTLVFDKLAEMLVYDRLSILHPRTVLLPRFNRTEDVKEMVAEPDWAGVEARIGFPCILKPVDGYAWQDVFRIADRAALRGLYESLKDSRTFIVQELVQYVSYYRAFCVDGREVFIVRWTPRPFDMGEYAMPDAGELGGVRDAMEEKTRALNRALGLDFNTVEWCVTKEGALVVIDSLNDVPDVRREKLPPECYAWVVERFSGLVREKLSSEGRNSIPPAPGSEPGTLSR